MIRSTTNVLLCFLLIGLPLPSQAKVPPIDNLTDANSTCDTCGGSSTLYDAEVIKVAAKKSGGAGRFPLPSCRGLRNDKKGKGAYGRSRKGGKHHAGVDWYAPVGTSLMSPKAGVVELAGDSGKGGYRVRIQHNDGTTTVYMHMGKSLSVKPGQKVQAGTKLGTVGKTGNADSKAIQPHVHFEYWIGGKKVNPTKYFGCSK